MIQGKTPEIVLTRSVFKNITAKRKDVAHVHVGADASGIVAGNHHIVFKTSGVVDYTDYDRHLYTFYKVYNSLLAEKAIPIAMELNILLPMEAKEKDIKAAVKEYDNLCRIHGMEITGGNTQVTDTVNTIVTTVTMVGEAVEDRRECADRIKNAKALNDDHSEDQISVIMTKAMGIEGTAVIARNHESMLRERFNGRFVDECLCFKEHISIEKEARVVMSIPDTVMHDVSSTGVYGAIWELAVYFGMGASVDLKSIPVWQETIEVTELFDINPYKMTSSGSVLVATRTPELVLDRLEDERIPSCIIGHLVRGNDKILINNDEIRYLEPPRGDDIYLQNNK